eukprot:31526_1
MLVLRFLFTVACFIAVHCKLPYCQPSDNCWPSQSEINAFSKELDGTLVIQDMSNPQYIQLTTTVQNNYRITYPSFIILISSHSDVQKCVSFASLHNIQITIRSTGHSYSGRFSANNSLQINLSSMQKFSFNKDISPPTLTIETGMRFGTAFGLVNATMPDYVLVGAGDPSVAAAGYSSLGGHSPLTPMYGLSADFIQEYYIVDANANIVHVYNTSSANQSIDNLYWALKGGGASTFGVILNITFNLNKVQRENPDDVYNSFNCYYSLYNKPFIKQEYIGYDVLYGYFDLIPTLDPSIAGYFVIQYDVQLTTYVFGFEFVYFGNQSYAKEMFFPFTKLNPYNSNHSCTVVSVNYFWDLWSGVQPDINDGNLYLWNDFIPQENITYQYANQLLDIMNATNPLKDGWGFAAGSATLIGGANNLNNYPYGVQSAVGAGFRAGYYSFSMAVHWDNLTTQHEAISFGQKWERTFREYGYGIYSNEENYECVDCDWKQEFWQQSVYDRLLSVKNEFDPNQVFWCNHCVGSDESISSGHSSFVSIIGVKSLHLVNIWRFP